MDKMHGVLAVFLIMTLCIVTANEEPQGLEAYSELGHSGEPDLNGSKEAQRSDLPGMSDFLIADKNASIDVLEFGSVQKSALKAVVPEVPGAETVSNPEEDPEEDSRSNMTGQHSGGITIEGDSIRRGSSGKISHTFFAKVNTGIFVNSGENRTLTPSVRPTGTELDPTVLPKDVNQKDTEKDEEPKGNDKVKAESNDTLERSELYNREPVPITFQHHHRDTSGCAHQSCGFPVSGRESDDTFIEDNEDEPKISVRMLMAPTDEYFYMSSDTLQDLWQNHINADSSLPLDIIETSADELIEYYQLPPDPDFIVPVMTSPPETNDERVHQYAQTPKHMPQQPVFDTAQNKEGLPDESHYSINFPNQQVLPTAAPGVFDQVLPRPPVYYDAPTVLQGLYPMPIYTTPAYTQMTGSSSNVIRNYIQQPPEYRNIPSSSISGLQFHPGAINQTLLSMGINNILENVPPSFVIHSPTDMPTLQFINAVTGMIPGLMMEHGSGSYFPDIYGRGSHVRYPEGESPLMPQPATPGNSGGIMEAPKWERDDPLVHTITDDTGDTHLIIRIKSPSTTTTKQPVTVVNVPDTNRYSEITLEDGKKIFIRFQDEKKEDSPIQPPATQPSNPPQGTFTQNYLRNNPNQKIRPMRPRVSGKPKRRIPSQSRPAHDRFSSTGLADMAEENDRIFINANLGNLLNKGAVGGTLNKGVQGSGYGMGNTGSTYNTGYGGASSGMGNKANTYGMGNTGNPPGVQNYGTTYGSGGKGNIFNKGGLTNSGGKFDLGGLGNVFNDLKKNNPFTKGNLQNIFNKLNKGSPFGSGGLGSLTDKFSTGNLFDKGSLDNIKSEITNSVSQVQNKFQKLVGPLQTQVDTSFESAVGFLQMFFSQVIPGDYYENVLTILAILAFIAFVTVRLSLMFNSLGSSVTFGLFGRAEEVLNSIRESDQVQVMQDLASDVYKSIELWAQENLEIPSSGISNLFFIDKITGLFGFGKSSKETTYSNVNESNLVKKTLLTPHNESLPGESTKHNLSAEIFEELDGAARLGSTLVDLTWRTGGHHSPVTETSCLQRPLCDLNAISDREGGLSSLLIPLASTGVSWLTRPSEDVFAFLEIFRPLWLSNTFRQGEGCRRIHPCKHLT